MITVAEMKAKPLGKNAIVRECVEQLDEVKAIAAREGHTSRMLEAAVTNTPDAGVMFDEAVRLAAFRGFAESNTIYERFVDIDTSQVPSVQFLLEGVIGDLQPYSAEIGMVNLGNEGTVTLSAETRGVGVPITQAMMLFDQTGLIARTAVKIGEAAARTLDKMSVGILSTQGNYGSNTAAKDFSYDDFEAAVAAIRQSKVGGEAGMYTPNMVIAGASAYPKAQRLLRSANLTDGSTNAEGSANPYAGDYELLYTPHLAAAEWVVLDSQATGVGMHLPIAFELARTDENSEAWVRSRQTIYGGSVMVDVKAVDLQRAGYFGRGA